MKRKDVLLFFWALCILVFAWIGFTIYHVSVTSTIEEPLQIQIIGIKPTFDTKTIEKLKQREKVTPLLNAVEATPSATLSITPTPTTKAIPTPSPTVQTVSAPSATPTGSFSIPLNTGGSNL